MYAYYRGVILDPTTAHDAVLDMDRAAFDALVTARAHALVEAHPRQATYPTEAHRQEAERAFEDATELLSIAGDFADQVDRFGATPYRPALHPGPAGGRPSGYADAVLVVGDAPVVVLDSRWSLYRPECEAEARGHIDLVVLGGPLVQYLLTGQATTWRA